MWIYLRRPSCHRTLQVSEYQRSGIHNHKGECSGVLKEEGARAVLNPGREETAEVGRMKEPEEPMFTITATDRHGVAYRAESGSWCQGVSAVAGLL